MMERELLEELFESYCETAKGIFYSGQEVQPYIFIFPASDGMPIPVLRIEEDKEKVACAVQVVCEKVNAVAGLIVSEGWMAKFEKGEKWDGTPPSKRLDRVEILQVALFSKVLNKMKSWKIINVGSERTLEDIPEQGEGTVASSRFFGDYFRVDA